MAEKYQISRERQDRFALESHRRAVAAIKSGKLKDQIVPVCVPCKKSEMREFSVDESPREDTSLEKLARLKPAFKQGGTVTAGNAPGTNDGAAATLVTSAETAQKLGKKPMARIVAQAVSGVEPRWVMMAPIDAVESLLKRTGWKVEDVDLVELNEAFAVQAVAVIEQLGLDPQKTNVNGGAVALGHPIGASGARILVDLLYEMERRDARRGVAALCLGGGNVETGHVDPSRLIANWRTAWHRACELAGVSRLRYHDLRHSAVTKMLQNGVPIATVAQVLGWSASTAIRMAKRYGHIRPEAQRQALELIATVLPSTMADEREADFAGASHQVPHQAPNVN
ncbi:MAG TPA: acetyl-CoA C-acyltransferase [Terriglobia bacterium]|nr:acetyl-CoA C-acyltransferase [Terriglobia bacterium]